MMQPKYSVVVPVYNEEESVKPLAFAIKRVMDALKEAYEIVFVNDGSTDRTHAYLTKLRETIPSLKILTLDENSGQTTSLKLGFEMSKGDIVITMDGDLQNDPRDIPLLLHKLGAGVDVVCGWRKNRHDSLWKKLASKIANIVQREVFRSNLHDISCTLRAYRKDALNGLDLDWKGAHRFIPYLLINNKRSVAEVVVKHHPRKFGKSKYSPLKIFGTVRDFIKLLSLKK